MYILIDANIYTHYNSATYSMHAHTHTPAHTYTHTCCITHTHITYTLTSIHLDTLALPNATYVGTAMNKY